MKKHLALLLSLLIAVGPAFAGVEGGPALMYDSSGNALNSTSNALNSFITNGTIAVTQSGTWTVQPGNTANTTPWLVTVSTALPTGANTIGSVNQGTSPWIVAGGGTAGTPATGVVTIQGIAGGTTVPISGTVTANNASVSTTGTAPPGSATYIGGSVTTAAPSYTTGQMNALSLTTSGSLRVDGSGSTQPVSGTVSATQSGTWTVQPGNTANTTPWLVTVSTALPTGSNTIGAVTQASGPWTQNLTQVGGSSYSLGQKTMANSAPVVIASDQSAIPVTQGNPTVATYVATAVALAPASAATDVFTITGSGTKVIRVWKVRVLGNKTAGSAVTMNLVKRSTLDTGGTSAAVTAVSMDSGDGAATATVSSYTANPTGLGTSVGIASANPTFIPNSVTQLFQALFDDFGMRKPLVLNNANENLALNLGGATVSGGSLTIEVTWTEQ